MIRELANHLWQSTAFAAVVGLLTLFLRSNRAAVRYWLWFVASLKFLVPLALLTSAGSWLEWKPAAASASILVPAITQVLEPISVPQSRAISQPGGYDWPGAIVLGLWVCGSLAMAWFRFRAWRRIHNAIRASTPVDLPFALEVRECPGLLEPGVVGFMRPILLLPAGNRERLTPGQFEAVLAHELCHVRRRDNLTAAVHMVVEVIFWFHPLVWWIGARLVEERERACDEAVMQSGGEPHVYAEAVLRVCKHYQESPLACVPGITGADLKKRIEAIMTGNVVQNLSVTKWVLLVTGGCLALMTPVAIGVLNPAQGRAQTRAVKPHFETVSIKPNTSADTRPLLRNEPGGRIAFSNITAKKLIEEAYGVKHYQILGGASWTSSERFDVAAKPEGEANGEQGELMLQSLLEDRFQLTIRRETRQSPVYALLVAKGGVKFKQPSEADPDIVDMSQRMGPAPDGRRRRFAIIRRGRFTLQGVAMSGLAGHLSSAVGRTVLDKTGLTGTYDLKLEWQPDESQNAMFQAVGVPEGFGAPAADWKGPSLFTALQEQLGLKLESQKGPVEVLVIERLEKPSAN